MTVYQYKIPRKATWKAAVPKANEMIEPEGLTGFIDGQKASDLEERFAIALRLADLYFEYQPSFIAMRNMPGEIRPDFVVNANGSIWPIMIDGDWSHKSSAQREEDEVKDQILDDHLRDAGARPTIRLREGDESVSFDTIADCQKLVAEIFG